jgi:hypothetical protein
MVEAQLRTYCSSPENVHIVFRLSVIFVLYVLCLGRDKLKFRFDFKFDCKFNFKLNCKFNFKFNYKLNFTLIFKLNFRTHI